MSDILDVDPGKKIDQVLKDHIAPFLKAKNFRRKGRHFWRDHGRVIDTLNLQKSQWNDSGDARFCINLGLVWPEVDATFPHKREGPHPSADGSTVFIRLGGLITGRDHWWEASSKTKVAELGTEIVRALTEYALPWLERGHDPKISCEYLERLKLTPRIEAFKRIYQL